MDVLRTPDDRFKDLPGFPFAPRYADINGMRMHYVDEGPRDAEVVLMLHGEPSWAYLYRKMIPIFVDAGYRAVVPDMFGFGRSDKPASQGDYTYQFHVDTVNALVEQLDLRRITLVCQDWGGLIGLRIAAEHEDRFSRIVAANTFLPTGDLPPGEAFLRWQQFSQTSPVFDIGRVINNGTTTDLPDEIVAAYNAPFPDDSYKAGARKFPALVPTRPDDPASEPNREAWKVLERWQKPFLTAFGDSDPITRNADRLFLARVPGTKGQPHTTIAGGGHFIQEDRGEELARVVVDFMKRS